MANGQWCRSGIFIVNSEHIEQVIAGWDKTSNRNILLLHYPNITYQLKPESNKWIEISAKKYVSQLITTKCTLNLFQN